MHARAVLDVRERIAQEESILRIGMVTIQIRELIMPNDQARVGKTRSGTANLMTSIKVFDSQLVTFL
jgi:hypothetical protein